MNSLPPGNPDAIPEDLAQLIDRLIAHDSHHLHAEVMAYVERLLLIRVLNDSEGNRSQAARVLGITRNSLRHKMNELRISIDRSAIVVDDQHPPYSD